MDACGEQRGKNRSANGPCSSCSSCQKRGSFGAASVAAGLLFEG